MEIFDIDMKRRHKRMIFRILLLFLLFLGTVAVVFTLSRKEEPAKTTVLEKTDAALPVIETKIDNSYMNLMHGYVSEMVGRYMRDTITPLPSDRKLQLRITSDGDMVKGIRYEIRSLDTTQLVENTQISSWDEKENSNGEREILVTLRRVRSISFRLSFRQRSMKVWFIIPE